MKYAFLLIFFLAVSISGVRAQDPIIVNFERLNQVIQNASPDTTYIVNFWATWCKPCVAELPYFEAFYERYADQPYRMILVSLDFKSQFDSRVVPFVQKRSLKPPVWLLDAGDPNKWIDLVDPSWSGAIPATLFFQGKNRKFVEDSFHDLEAIETIIHSLKS
jgi:thiol-disulfide isomerase/thioredoxin